YWIANNDSIDDEYENIFLKDQYTFLTYYQTITYSDILCGENNFHSPSHEKSFCLISLIPSKDILVIDSIYRTII
ncbi:hypothetical protein H5410_052673, partial [Solanum commersonii]